jgi:hypothetical protein
MEINHVQMGANFVLTRNLQNQVLETVENRFEGEHFGNDFEDEAIEPEFMDQTQLLVRHKKLSQRMISISIAYDTSTPEDTFSLDANDVQNLPNLDVNTPADIPRLAETPVSNGVGMKKGAGKNVDRVHVFPSFAAVLRDLPQTSNHGSEFQETCEKAADWAHNAAVEIKQSNFPQVIK